MHPFSFPLVHSTCWLLHLTGYQRCSYDSMQFSRSNRGVICLTHSRPLNHYGDERPGSHVFRYTSIRRSMRYHTSSAELLQASGRNDTDGTVR
jgi:hypothetical protein